MPFVSITKPITAPRATASIGDRVWFDANANGIQDAGEMGVAGITMSLVKPGAYGPTVVATTTTDANGYYHFNNLAAGSYAVGMYQGWGVTTSKANAGADDRDSDFFSNMKAPGSPSVSTSPWMQTQYMSLAAGQSNQSVDLGITSAPWLKPPVGTASLGDFVWADKNANGIQDAGEAGLAGITMTLIKPGFNGSTVLATTVTDSTGHYRFDKLAAGTYAVGMYQAPGVLISKGNVGADDKDSDFNVATAPGNPSVSTTPWVESTWVKLAAGESNHSLDLGIKAAPGMQSATGSVDGFVWADTNGNGIQDSGETGMAGMFMQLAKPGNLGGTYVRTDSTGHYHFDYVTPGTYEVVWYGGKGVTISGANAGADDHRDSDFALGPALLNPEINTNPWAHSAFMSVSEGQSIHSVDLGVSSAPWLTVADKLGLFHPSDDLLHRALGAAAQTGDLAHHVEAGEALRALQSLWSAQTGPLSS